MLNEFCVVFNKFWIIVLNEFQFFRVSCFVFNEFCVVFDEFVVVFNEFIVVFCRYGPP